MRWSDRNEDNLDALIRGEGGTKLGASLTELREHKTEPSTELRERMRALAAEEPEHRRRLRLRVGSYRPRFAHVGSLAAVVLLIAIAIPIATRSGDSVSNEASGDAGSAGAVTGQDSGAEGDALEPVTPPAAPPPPRLAPTRRGGGGSYAAPPPAGAREDMPNVDAAKRTAAPLPSTTRAQDYSASIKLHVDDHDELSEAVQSAIRSTRRLGGYVTYVDYDTKGKEDGAATLGLRVPVGRVQTAVARFSQLGTILEQQTEIVDLQGPIDRITRDVQRRRDRIAKLEAELKDPTLSKAERKRLEARIVQAKRGLANATHNRAGVLRQSRFAKLDLSFTTVEEKEPAAPPSDLEQTLDDASGILAAELGVLLFILIAGAPFIALGLLAWFGARAARRASGRRILERA